MLFLILSSSTNLFAQALYKLETETEEAILWTTDRPLRLSDFQGPIDSTSSKKAITGANIIIVPYAFNNGTYEYHVLAKFHKDISWINTKSEYILQHEQIHFDIAELYARKMRRDIAKVKKATGQVLPSDYKRIHKSLFRSYYYFQKRYDTQTHHSTDQDEQRRWNAIVADELKTLESFNLGL